MNKLATEKLKTLCIEEIKTELNIEPSVSNYIISFKLSELDSEKIEVLNNLASMCKELKVKAYKMSSLSIKLIFEI